MTRRTTFALGFAILLLGLGTSASAANVAIELNVGPPAVVYEEAPPPRVGYVWAQGYWDYDHGHHVWRKGHWEHERKGQHWRDGAWTEHDGHWSLSRGRWEREHAG